MAHNFDAVRGRRRVGFSLIEMLAAISILLIVSGVVMGGVVQMIRTQGSLVNRSALHSNVRSATELLQQEIGQAGTINLPAAATLQTAITSIAVLGSSQTFTVVLSSVAGMYAGEQILVDAGSNQETVSISAVNTVTTSITADFYNPHAIGAPIAVHGAFAQGIVPTTTTNGSTGSVLKLFGDINDDGNMVYIEYTCDTTNHYLYRNSMAWNAASKPAVTSANVLLANVQPNPGSQACFVYQQQVVGNDTYVTDVAVTLTVQTQQKDPKTNQYQTETKALLNVSPRNIFDAWELASAGAGASFRVQPIPPSVIALLP